MEETVSTPTHTEETVSTPNTYRGNCFNINITEKLSPPALYQRVHRIREVRVPEAFCGLFAVVHRSRDITVRGPRKKKKREFLWLAATSSCMHRHTQAHTQVHIHMQTETEDRQTDTHTSILDVNGQGERWEVSNWGEWCAWTCLVGGESITC